MAKVLMKGNEAIAEAAIQAGCRFFFRLPHHAPESDSRIYVQAACPRWAAAFCRLRAKLRPSTWSMARLAQARA